MQSARYLSDPTAFPMALKAWILSFIEGSDIDLPMQNVHGLLEALDAPVRYRNLPTGLVLLFAGPVAPEGTHFHPLPQVQAQAPPGLKFIVVD